MREALTATYQQEKYQKALNFFLDETSSQFSAVSYILSEKENECITRMLADLHLLSMAPKLAAKMKSEGNKLLNVQCTYFTNQN